MRLLLRVIKPGGTVAEETVVQIPAGDGVTAYYGEIDRSIPTAEEALKRAEEEIGLRRAQCDALIAHDRMEAEETARQIHEEATAERDRMLDEARRKSIQLMEDARLEGIEKGFQAKASEIDAMLKRMNSALQELKQEQENFFQQYAAQTQDFALEIAGKILHEQITLDPVSMKNLIMEAIGNVRDAEWITVKLSSRSGELIKLLNEHYQQADSRKIAFTENRSAPGTCIVDTPNETIDASIQVQLENLRQLFQKAARN